jgi:hypothetical protein
VFVVVRQREINVRDIEIIAIRHRPRHQFFPLNESVDQAHTDAPAVDTWLAVEYVRCRYDPFHTKRRATRLVSVVDYAACCRAIYPSIASGEFEIGRPVRLPPDRLGRERRRLPLDVVEPSAVGVPVVCAAKSGVGAVDAESSAGVYSVGLCESGLKYRCL